MNGICVCSREAAATDETPSQSKSLTQDRLKTLMESVQIWQSEQEKRTGKLPRFPSALSVSSSPPRTTDCSISVSLGTGQPQDERSELVFVHGWELRQVLILLTECNEGPT